jgi:hypothetical protein
MNRQESDWNRFLNEEVVRDIYKEEENQGM